MTSFDKAFIKAYTDAPHAADETSAVAPPHAAELKPTAPTRLGGSPARAEELGTARTAASTSPSPAPQPLSSFTAKPKMHDYWRAMLEVDHFQWPANCDELLDSARADWDRFADALSQRMAGGAKCLGIGGISRDEGRSTTALALAKLVASRGLRPVIVDASLHRPELADACGVSVHTGWDDLLASELTLGESLIAAVEDGVTLMPWRTAADSAVTLPSGTKARTIFGTLREHYDLTILDLPPLAGKPTIAEFAAFAAAIHLDSLYLLNNVREGSAAALAEVVAKLRRAGVTVTGVIENFVSSGKRAGLASAASGHRTLSFGS